MEHPGAPFAGFVDLIGEIAQAADELVLLSPIPQPVPEMMRERRQVKLQINGKRLLHRGHCLECFARPESSAAEH
jgi:hypothetical protein